MQKLLIHQVDYRSKFTIELECDEEIISKIVNQIKRIVEVKSIEFFDIIGSYEKI
jgi:hypothetical protein